MNRGESFFNAKDDYMNSLYKTKKIRRGWIVVNKETGNHSHFRSSYGCRCILIFIEKGIIPDNTYLRESYRRLTEPRKKYKDRYVNNVR